MRTKSPRRKQLPVTQPWVVKPVLMNLCGYRMDTPAEAERSRKNAKARDRAARRSARRHKAESGLLKIDDVADILKCSRSTVRRMWSAGTLPEPSPFGVRGKRWTGADVMVCIERMKQKG